MGVANLYKAINQKLDTYPEIEEIISERILSELPNLLDKGILDSVKDGTFKGWGV